MLQTKSKVDTGSVPFDLKGCSVLLATIVRLDPVASVRAKAVTMTACPAMAVGDAMFDCDRVVRRAALEAVSQLCVKRVSTAFFIERVMALLAVESDEALIVTALNIVRDLLRDSTTDILHSKLLPAFGCQDSSESELDQVLSPLESFGVIRDLAEHDSARIRVAICAVLLNVLSRTLGCGPGSNVKGSESCFEKICSATIEQLLQDTNRAVQLSVINELSCSHHEVSRGSVGRVFRFSENCVKSILEMVVFPLRSDVQDDVESICQVMYIFRAYPCANVSAYALLETYLRRRLYWAQNEYVTRQSGAKRYLQLLEGLLNDVVHRNVTFARVLDLVRPPSDKLCSIRRGVSSY